jgi:hypothetical protein
LLVLLLLLPHVVRGVVESLLAGGGLMKRKDVWWIDEEDGCLTKVRNDGKEERRTGKQHWT